MPIIKNHIELCSSPRSRVCDEQAIGNYCIWERYSQIAQIVNNCIEEPYRSFLARPMSEMDPSKAEEVIHWFMPDTQSTPIPLSALSGRDQQHYRSILETTIKKYKDAAEQLRREGHVPQAEHLEKAMHHVGEHDELIYCAGDKVVVVLWGMRPKNTSDISSCVVEHNINKRPSSFTVTFDLGEHGSSTSELQLRKVPDTEIYADQVPLVTPEEGWVFLGWQPEPMGCRVNQDITFTAMYQQEEAPAEPEAEPEHIIPPVIPTPIPPQMHRVRFLDGDGKPVSEYQSIDGAAVDMSYAPQLKAPKRQKFDGWQPDPQQAIITHDTDFRPRFTKKKCCIAGLAPFWKWVLGVLLGLLLLLLLFLLLRNCSGCSRHEIIDPGSGIDSGVIWDEDPYAGNPGIYNPDDPYTARPTDPNFRDILPPNEGVLPPLDDGNIIDLPDGRRIVSNRLNVLMDNDDKSIMDLARTFKQLYPSDAYKVVYYDNVVKRMQIEIPSSERETIRQALPGQVSPEYCIYVYDESMFEQQYTPTDPAMSNADKSWYLSLVNAPQAWDVTRGSSNVKVAVVDAGFYLEHPELAGKVVRPYNVWSHSNQVTGMRDDHGTHVAATAVGNMNNGKGLCGIAPECKLIPVQVADARGNMTVTSILDGILYSIYQGADVVNVSLGMCLGGQIPTAMQLELQNRHFKEEENLWNEVMRIAERHKTIIVMAAGNDNVLAGVDPTNRPRDFVVVSAVGKDGQRVGKANFSNYGDYVSVSAPGLEIYNAYGKNGYESLSGTSMAAPIVTGAIALMKSIDSTVTAQQAMCVLMNTGVGVSNKIGKVIQIDKALAKVKAKDYSSCTDTADMPTPRTGDVQVLLSWHNLNDLDLICTDPYGQIVWYRHPHVSSGGTLDIDMNCSEPLRQSPIENIYWPTGGAPKGTYRVEVLYYGRHDPNEGPTSFEVMVKNKGQETKYNGKLESPSQKKLVTTFTVN